MGKAALLITFSAALFVALGLLGQTETERHTAQTQADYENGVVAREIARSGFNVAMGILRDHGNDIHAAIKAINRHGTGKKYLEGEHQGGTFRAQAELVNGAVVRVTAVGYHGGEFVRLKGDEDAEAGWCRQADPFSGEHYTGACHTMSDLTGDSPIYEYELPSGDPLTSKFACGKLDVEFIDSMAGYCSAVYLVRTLPSGVDEDGETLLYGEPEDPEMLFIPGNDRDGQTLSISKHVRGGTRMNFFIGVDKDCSYRSTSTSVEGYPTFTGSEESPSPYDHLHFALMEDVSAFDKMTETPWAFTEMHPSGIDESGPTARQRWRIGWEDQHITDWDDPNSNDPTRSLQALKRHGYDGVGWPDTDGRGYRELRDYGSRPDFSDQVVEVVLMDEADESLCYPEEEAEEPPAEEPPAEDTSATCGCPKNNKQDHKVAIWHHEGQGKGKGNTGQEICIAESAVSHHLANHNDHVICRGD